MNFKKYHVSKNLFDKSTAVDGYGVDNNSGNLFRSAALSASDYINISGESYIRATYITSSVANQYGAFYDNNKTFISGYSGYSNAIAVPQNAVYTRITARTEYIDEFMLNSGSQPLPYEPYSSEVWHDIPHYIHNTSTDTITTPADIYPNDTTATVGLKGNMEQPGTPTPTTPIQPSECGERTAQLFDGTIVLQDVGMDSNRYGFTITKAGTYTVNITGVVESNDYCYGRTYSNGEWSQFFYLTTGSTKYRYTVSISENEKLVIFNASGAQTEAQSKAKFDRWKIMANTGSQSPPYEPYGYKIPILNGSQTTNVYLGEMETTRQVKKLVLTGEEIWAMNSNRPGLFYVNEANFSSLTPDDYVHTAKNICVCSHFGTQSNVAGVAAVNDEKACFYYNTNYPTAKIFYIRCDVIETVEGWTTFLTEQYAAGTPVIVWYVLATETTGIVNEPIRKIGDYADEVSGITIPTIAGANTISVDTTLLPSEVTATYKGWHPVQSVHERENGAWT